jgi:5-methyltetrahydropteroyltriglutamate--homocysteine methyltransferase
MATNAPHNPPFRADHVGSFLRPPELLQARDEFKAGKITAVELRQREDEAIGALVAWEERIGLQSITDGEYRREGWSAGFYGGGSGIRPADPSTAIASFKGRGGIANPAPAFEVYERLRWRHPINVENFKFLRSRTSRTPKVTIPSPTYVHLRAGRPNISREVYPDMELFWQDMVEACSNELKALGEAGCKYVQIDETTLCALSDPASWEHIRARGEDPHELMLETYPTVMNRAFAGRPGDMVLAMHLCRGNARSNWSAEGGYDLMADTLFNKIDVDAYFMEYDTPRAGSFEPLRFVPKNKTVVLGLVSTKFPEIESKDMLKRRIEEAARYIDIGQLSLSPQCGFASVAAGNLITPEQQEAKMRVVIETAREVWG